jgi:hypothetical protein
MKPYVKFFQIGIAFLFVTKLSRIKNKLEHGFRITGKQGGGCNSYLLVGTKSALMKTEIKISEKIGNFRKICYNILCK